MLSEVYTGTSIAMIRSAMRAIHGEVCRNPRRLTHSQAWLRVQVVVVSAPKPESIILSSIQDDLKDPRSTIFLHLPI